MRHDPRFLLTAVLFAVGGCASTTVSEVIPSPQDPICRRSATAEILWTTQWRPEQKDVLAREAAAADGLAQSFEGSGCFKTACLRRVPQNSQRPLHDAVAEATARVDTVGVVSVRELGPTVKIGASLALVEGGTEVVLDLSEYVPGGPAPRTFTVRWRNGGSGVLKGVATLPHDMQAALAVGLQPPAR